MKYIVGGIALAISKYAMHGKDIDLFLQGSLATNAFWLAFRGYEELFTTTTKLRR